MMKVVYLHGFASSPQSTKAKFFERKFAGHGISMQVPQLDQGNFEGLTITGQLSIVENAVAGQPVMLLGSSLGGYIAALYAARHSEVERLVLLAPAFEFPSRWKSRFTAEALAGWKRHGSLPFFHYGHGREMPLGYQFVEDALTYEDRPELSQPVLVLHGLNDPVVPPEVSRRFASLHPNVRLELLDSGHEMTDVLDQAWALTAEFLAVLDRPEGQEFQNR